MVLFTLTVCCHVPVEDPCLRECMPADGALVWLLSGVLAQVHGQLPLPGKLPVAVLPRADVRLLASVRPLVACEVTENFGTKGEQIVLSRTKDS